MGLHKRSVMFTLHVKNMGKANNKFTKLIKSITLFAMQMLLLVIYYNWENKIKFLWTYVVYPTDIRNH